MDTAATSDPQVEIKPNGPPPTPPVPSRDEPKDDDTPQRSAKRQKVTRACDNCKSRKRRCTGELPCSLWANGSDCTYNASYTRGRLVQPLPSTRAEGVLSAPESSSKPGQPSGQNQTKAGGEVTEGVSSNARSSRNGSPEGETATLAGQYSGPTSAYSFLRRAWRRFGLNVNQDEDKESAQTVPIFSYGDKQLPRSGDGISNFSLPDQQTAAELFSIYFDFAMPTYRFLHQPTAMAWLQSYQDYFNNNPNRIQMLPARQAIVLMILATATIFKKDSNSEIHPYKRETWQKSEPYFQKAQVVLASETGKVRLESVQARLAVCLYLLHTSRPNQAWYTFGITCQILTALGMHRARGAAKNQTDTITTECRKRAFWSAFSLDTYLSVILGRPTLLHSDDVDQQFPEPADDDEVTATGIVKSGWRRDPIMNGAIFHSKITRITKKAIKEQYSVLRHKDSHRLNVAAKLNAEIADWQKSLPVVLSGAIHPSSLIQIFQRQIVVLELAHSLAVILSNRPLLLIDSNVDNKTNVNACLSAAKKILDTVTGFVSDTRTFPSFWYTQNVTFNALSVVYVWLIQRKRGRLSSHNPPHTDEELFQLAEAIHKYLGDATLTNAPSLRYSIILEELQQEASRLMAKSNKSRPPNLNAIIEPPADGHPYSTPLDPSEGSPSSNRANSMSWDSLSGDFPLDPDIWLQFDAFPFPEMEFDDLNDLT